MKIYVASSWKNNNHQPEVVIKLREAGHEVYDFRNPPSGAAFMWDKIDSAWESWSLEEYLRNLKHPLAEAGFESDFDAMQWADAFILVMPSGNSAHLEAGWAIGAGKPTAIYLPEQTQADLMYKLADEIHLTVPEICAWLDKLQQRRLTMPKMEPENVKKIEDAVEQYVLAVEASPLTDESKKTYIEHPRNFVRWLKGEFEPGGSVQVRR